VNSGAREREAVPASLKTPVVASVAGLSTLDCPFCFVCIRSVHNVASVAGLSTLDCPFCFVCIPNLGGNRQDINFHEKMIKVTIFD
jgi:hypothetical protein